MEYEADQSSDDPTPSLDKLSLTLPMHLLPGEKRKDITRALTNVVASRDGRKLSDYKKGFKQRYLIPVTDDEKMLIEYQPHRPDHAIHALRAEFNPNKIGRNGCDQVRAVLNELFGEESKKLRSALHIQDIDWCLDYPGLSARDVICHTSEKQSCSTYGKRFGSDAEMETLYEGSPKSDSQTRTYNKSREILSALVQNNPLMKIEDLEKKEKELGKIMRVESCLRNLRLHPSMLHEAKNPFENIHFYNLPQIEKVLKSDIGRLFIDSIRLHGLGVALRRIHEPNMRRRLQRAVAKHRVEWWNPDRFTAHLVDAVRNLRILPDEVFDQLNRHVGDGFKRTGPPAYQNLNIKVDKPGNSTARSKR